MDGRIDTDIDETRTTNKQIPQFRDKKEEKGEEWKNLVKVAQFFDAISFSLKKGRPPEANFCRHIPGNGANNKAE